MVGNTRAVTRKMANDRILRDTKPVKRAKPGTLAVSKTSDENLRTNGKKFGGEKVKRMAQNSPQEAPLKKRSAFGDVTNAGNRKVPLSKNVTKPTKSKPIAIPNKLKVHEDVTTTEVTATKVKNCIILSSDDQQTDLPSLENETDKSISSSNFDNDSLEINLSEEDIFKLSSDGLTQETSSSIEASTADTVLLSDTSSKIEVSNLEDFHIPEVVKNLPDGVRDVDQDIDPFSVCEYVESIFRNMKISELKFPVTKYLDGKKQLTAGMRAILIDWLVEVQENFELFHETLYLAIRIIDLYLQKKECKREKLQLIGATAMFIASKIEERHTPPLDDFVFVCDDAYKSSQFTNMEIDILATLNFQLGIPISYRFLRRFSRVAGAPMETLTLARYILESSLLEYEFVDCRQSHIAAAALNLAFRMKNIGTWDKTLVYHTGYEECELKDLVIRLNKVISSPPKKNLTTIRMKYSHPVFSEVAKIPTITIEE